jgi:hypothetical protein
VRAVDLNRRHPEPQQLRLLGVDPAGAVARALVAVGA